MKCFSFRLSGRLGHFRKFYTTASALSYDFPPPTTIRGLIAAVVGCEDYIKTTSEFNIGIVIERVEGKMFLGLNLLNIKDPKKLVRTQANRQVLINPSYRIHLCGQGDLFETFADMVQEGKSHYHPYLGKTSYPARLEPIGFQQAVFVGKSDCIYGVFPPDCTSNLIEVLKQRPVFKDRIPISFQEGRKSPSYIDIFYTTKDNPLSGEFINIYKVGVDYVYLFSS